eukprot:CAMPEP_0185739194 /NCGR_PEP_ID=MMETSP1171-20130828/34829_1 /TAXON_ID=374046 /ORGANISM="Helicotheca tamensis, Strain CCMP826" /LENGTH=121 /DNA_ID=CAMNT_0028410669 /DNA_START=184 /DNA_END=549 /DNA_ORIENTATION=-
MKAANTLFLLVAFFVANASGKPSFTFQLKDKSLNDSNKVDLQNSGDIRSIWGKRDDSDEAEQTTQNVEGDAESVSRLVASRRDDDAEKSILSILEEIRETKRELQEEMEALRAEASDLMAA